MRRIVVIDRSRGVCGESDVGVVAVSEAFATATVIPTLAVKKTLASYIKKAGEQKTQTPRLAEKKIWNQ